MNKYLIGSILGFIMGALAIHPVSVLLQGAVHPNVMVKVPSIINAFDVHHLPMAFFFGVLGTVFGLTVTHYTARLSSEQTRVQMLESLIPICSYCKKIREEDPGGKTHWHEVEHYMAMKTNSSFTHSICPECFENEMQQLDKEDAEEAAKSVTEPAQT